MFRLDLAHVVFDAASLAGVDPDVVVDFFPRLGGLQQFFYKAKHLVILQYRPLGFKYRFNWAET